MGHSILLHREWFAGGLLNSAVNKDVILHIWNNICHSLMITKQITRNASNILKYQRTISFS